MRFHSILLSLLKNWRQRTSRKTNFSEINCKCTEKLRMTVWFVCINMKLIWCLIIQEKICNNQFVGALTSDGRTCISVSLEKILWMVTTSMARKNVIELWDKSYDKMWKIHFNIRKHHSAKTNLDLSQIIWLIRLISTWFTKTFFS